MLNRLKKREPEREVETRAEYEALAEEASQGCKKALCKLCEKISKGVLFQLTYILGNQSNAEDVSQEVLIRVCMNIRSLRNPKAFKGWLARIIVNEKNRYLAKHMKQGGTSMRNIDDYLERIMEEDDDVIPHGHVENEELNKIVMEVISDLPMRQREAVMLRYYSDLSVTEVAESMNVTTQTVSKSLALAHEKLKRGLGDQEVAGDYKSPSASAYWRQASQHALAE